MGEQRPSFDGLWGEATTAYRANLPVLLMVAAAGFAIPAVVDHLPLPPLLVFPIAYAVHSTALTVYAGIVALHLSAATREGEGRSIGTSVPAIGPRLTRLSIAGIVVGVATVGGILCLVLPGLVLLTMWFVVAPLIALDDLGVIGSLRGSWQLVRTRFWTVFLIAVATNFLLYGVWWLVVPAAAGVGRVAGMAGSELSYLIAAPVAAVMIACVRERLRTVPVPTGEDPRIATV